MHAGGGGPAHLLGFPPQHHFLLPLLGLQSSDLKLQVREGGPEPTLNT